MGLNILVVDRGEGDFNRWGHSLVFVKSAMVEGAVMNLTSFDFAMIHTSYPRILTVEAAWGERWEDVIGISGGVGGGVVAHSEVVGLPLIHAASQDDVLNMDWAGVPIHFNGSACDLASLLVEPTAPYSASFAILCQGYLVAHAEQGGARVQESLVRMGWSEDLNSMSVWHIHTLGHAVESPEWWLRPFTSSPDAGRSMVGDEIEKRLSNEWGGALPHGLAQLLQILKNPEQSRIGDSDIVAEAYLAVADRLTENYE